MDPSPLLQLPGAVVDATPGSPDGGLTAWHYGDPFREQRAASRGAGILIDGWARGTVRVTGDDRLTWLNALASQDFLALHAGDGTEALWLSPNGHLEHWAAVRIAARSVLLHTDTIGAATSLAAFLESRRFRADVQVADISDDLAALDVLSPNAASSPSAAVTSMTVPRREFAARAMALIAAGHTAAGTWAAAALRVAARRPRFGVDTDARTLPHETPYWLAAAVSLGKGCYCGQETVARIENIGAPPRRLVLLNLDGSGDVLPAAGDDVRLGDGADGKVVGRVGTVAQHWEDGPIALALVKRTVAPGVPLTAGGVNALIDPDDTVPAGPKRVYDRRQFIDLKR